MTMNIDALTKAIEGLTTPVPFDKALIKDATFHDTRRTALTRLAKKMPVMELAKISGHRDIRLLLNVYYSPTVEDLTSYFD